MKRTGMIMRFFAAILLATLLGSAGPSVAQSRLDKPLEFYNPVDLLGRWQEVKWRTADGEIKDGRGTHIAFTGDPEGTSGDIILHTDKRVWTTVAVSPPNSGLLTAEFTYKPKADEMNPAIPEKARKMLEGKLVWKLRLRPVGHSYSPRVRLNFFPGEVKWTLNEDTAEVQKVEIIGEGKPLSRYYKSDPIFEVSQRPTKSLEVLAFLGPKRRRPGETVTPHVYSMIQGQRIFPQAYLDERLADKAGDRISLTMRGETSGAEATLILERRGEAINGTVRYAAGLARVSHPLGRAVTLSGSCKAGEYYYPPFLSYSWLESFFATEELQKIKGHGSCLDFDGTTGEIVEFSIDEDTKFRVQWFKRWEHLALAKYRKTAEKLLKVYENATGEVGKIDTYIQMTERLLSIMDEPGIVDQQKLAVAELYLGMTGRKSLSGLSGVRPYLRVQGSLLADEYIPSGGLLFLTEEKIKSINPRHVSFKSLQEFDQERILATGRAPFRTGFALLKDQKMGIRARQAAAAFFPENCCKDNVLTSWEKALVDKALFFSSAAIWDRVGEFYATEGFRSAYGLFSATNPAAKVYTIFTAQDVFGQKVSDEYYWNNILDVAMEFTMLGFSAYEATSPFRYYKAEGGRIRSGDASFADLSKRSKNRFQARMTTKSGPPEKIVVVAKPKASARPDILKNVDQISDGIPPSVTREQRKTMVIKVNEVEPTIPPARQLPNDHTVQVRIAGNGDAGAAPPAAPTLSQDYGNKARFSGDLQEAFRSQNPDITDAAAANYIIHRKTGKLVSQEQGQNRFALALEGMSDGQRAIKPGALAYGMTEPVPDGLYAYRLQMEGIEASFAPMLKGIDYDRVRVMKAADWDVEVKIVSGGNSRPRRVVIENIHYDQDSLPSSVDFFDPRHGRVVSMDADEFHKMTVGEHNRNALMYRADVPDNPSPLQRPRSMADYTPENRHRFTGTPQQNVTYSFSTPDGDLTLRLGKQLGKGKVNQVFELPDHPGRVARISRGEASNTNSIYNDLYGRRVLADPGIDPDIIEPLKVHASRTIGNADGTLQVLEVVDIFKGKLAKEILEAQGGQMTKGQALAYVSAVRELNSRGVIWMDGHKENYSFIRMQGNDRWKIQIVDPGGMYAADGFTAGEKVKAAIRVQDTAFLAENFIVENYRLNPKEIGGYHINDIFSKHMADVDFDAMPGFVPKGGLIASFHTPFNQKDVRDLMGMDSNLVRRWQKRGNRP